jgi:hypothetical protein
MSFTHIHCKNGLGKRLLEEEGTKIRQGPALGTAGAPPAVRKRRRQWQEREPGGRGKGTAQAGSPTPPFYTQSPRRPDNPTKLSPDFPPPDIPPKGVDILAWNTREPDITTLDKTEILFDEKLNLCA